MSDVLSRRKMLKILGAAVGCGVADLGGLFPGVRVASAQSYTDPIIINRISSGSGAFRDSPPFTGYSIDIQVDYLVDYFGHDVVLVADVSRNVYYLLNPDGTEVEGSLKPLLTTYVPVRDGNEGKFLFPDPINMIQINVVKGNALIVVGSPRQPEDVFELGDFEIPRIEFAPNPGGVNENYGLRVIFDDTDALRNVIVHSFDNVMIDYKWNTVPADTYISTAALSGHTFTADDSDMGNFRLYDSQGNIVVRYPYPNSNKIYFFDADAPRKQVLIQDINESAGFTDVANAADNLSTTMLKATESTNTNPFFIPAIDGEGAAP